MRTAAEVNALIRTAARGPLLPVAERRSGPTLDRSGIESLVPQRDPFLFLDGVPCVDPAQGTIVCRYDLRRAAPVLAGHIPGRPAWPGVLQVEAVGQAGLCLVRLKRRMGRERESQPTAAGAESSPRDDFSLTHIVAARFMRPVVPGADLEIVACALPDGLFTLFVGQCLQEDAVCGVAAVRGIEKELEP
jgi:3-hydroxyacyl-[acyl-carrier-protein] dehydratase